MKLEAASSDVRAFTELLATLEVCAPSLRGFFAPAAERVIARAPGRLDVMGGIADYSGSLVLELPIHEAAFAAVALADDRVLRIASLDPSQPERLREFSVPLAQLESGSLSSYDAARRYFAEDESRQWAAYVAGLVLVLMRERTLAPPAGLSVLISSQVPEGRGVSSSAALEVSAMQAICGALGLSLEPSELAFLCQKAENLVAGAPCGVMDQMTAVLGRSGSCLLLRCQPAEIVSHVEIPDGVAIFGIDSGVRHAVSGSDYGDVRSGAFMGYRIIAEQAGFRVRPNGPDTVTIEDSRFAGYLANLSPEEFHREFGSFLPERMRGREFLERYHGTTDPLTRVLPEKSYPVYYPTLHPIGENARVQAFARLLGANLDEDGFEELAQLMYRAHESYSLCGLGSGATDRIVELVRESPRGAGLYGAKITGGGSGGTVAVLARAGALRQVERVVERYAALSGRKPHLFRGSSNGAAAFGLVRLARD